MVEMNSLAKAAADAAKNASTNNNTNTSTTSNVRTPIVFDYIHGVEEYPNSVVNSSEYTVTKVVNVEDEEVQKAAVQEPQQQQTTTKTSPQETPKINPNIPEQKTQSPIQQKSSGEPGISVSPDYNSDPIRNSQLTYNQSTG